MIKKNLIVLVSLILIVSCNRTYEKAMKSSDPEFILNTANQLYDKGRWSYATELYKKVLSSYVGKKEAEEIYLKSAYANYNDGQEALAAKQFKNFYFQFRNSPEAENALYMSAYSYYKGSPQYNLEQTNTYEAIKELQNFIDTYPMSKKVKEANELIDELRHKLEKKAFEIAKNYYVTLKYKAAAVNFANFIDDFPDSKYREEAYIYLLRSKAELALQSVFSKKKLRLKEAKTTYRLFTKSYPDSKYLKEAERWLNKITEEEISHLEQLKKIEDLKNKTEK